jgi:transcriptional regulator with GAF, ATPase, and Fis domain
MAWIVFRPAMTDILRADRRHLEVENTHLRRELRERYDFSNIISTSGPMRPLYEQVEQVASTNTTVLIRGESGTGKELIATAIHDNSLRAKKPFVKVSCAALPDTLIESELFGYERGAFTGGQQREQGKTIKRVSAPAIDALMSDHWPGNVRELENVLERAVLLCDGHVIHAHHLPATLQTAENFRHAHQAVASQCDGRIRERLDSGRTQDSQRQPRQVGEAARHDRTHRQLQDQGARHRLPALQDLAANPPWSRARAGETDVFERLLAGHSRDASQN